MLSEDECRKILETYMKMSVMPDQQPSRRITEQLTDEELELAAMRSYAYFVSSLHRPSMLSDEIRFATAMREAHRHLDGIDDVDVALKLLRVSLQFHKEQRTHLYKTCMQEDFEYSDEEDAKLAAQRRTRIIQENRDCQPMIIRGQDRQKNAVWLAMPRKAPGEEAEAFVDGLLYTIERCAATTEALTLGSQDKMIAVLDLKNSACPSVKAMKMGINMLQAHYPGRLKNLIVLDLNYILQGIYNCIKPFLDPETREKFVIVKGTKAKEAAISVHLDASQAQTNLLKDGKLSPEVDAEWFLKEVPFCRLYDYVPSCERPAIAQASETDGAGNHKHVVKRDEKKIPAMVKSPRTFKTKTRTLAVGSVTRCMTRITVTSIAT